MDAGWTVACRGARRCGVVTGHQPPRLDRIVIATDFSEPARVAAEWVLGVLAPEAEVLLVHALDAAAPASLGDPWPTVSDPVARRRP